MQNKAKLFRSMSGSPLLAAASLLCFPLSIGALAQSAEVSSAAVTVIPQQVRYTGTLPNRVGNTVEAVFRIYASAEGGEALWTETQQVSVGTDNTYSVLLGAASQSGLPQAVFAAGQARWVGVSIGRADELPRSPLSSVAYAMKAGDAESVGGLSAANLVTKDELAKMTTPVATAAPVQPAVQPETTPTGSGTADYVPLWTASATLGNSGIYQAASGFIGIGTTTPGGPLELATNATGGANATLMLEQTNGTDGNYYADLGLYNSNGLIGNLSALGAGYPAGQLFGPNDVVFLGGQQKATTNLIFVTNTGGALKFGTGGYAKTNERLRISTTGGVSVGNSYVATDPGAGSMILSGNLGIGTTAPAATLEVNGTAKFDGLITFDAGQTFPGTATGTITKVSASSPLTGGGSSGAVTVGLSTSALETTLNGVYAQLGASDTFADAATFNNGVTSMMQQCCGPTFSAVNGQSTNGSTGVLGNSDSGFGLEGESTYGAGVYGYGSGRSNTAISLGSGVAGVWGDTQGESGYGGIVGTADNNFAGYFVSNSSEFTTIVAQNEDSGGTGLFKVFKGVTPNGMCGIGDGDLSCTGQVKTLATTSGGSRTVETYSTQSAENWMEDYGTGALAGGVGVVHIDATFADTVTADGTYHVFLTPHGDSKGLYVTNLTPSSFEVRESGGGTATLSFDYKIVGKRRGYEAQRLVDVTDRFNAEQAETKRRMPAVIKARASKGVVEPRMAGNGPLRGTDMKPGDDSVLPTPTPQTNPVATPKPVANPVVPK